MSQRGVSYFSVVTKYVLRSSSKEDNIAGVCGTHETDYKRMQNSSRQI